MLINEMTKSWRECGFYFLTVENEKIIIKKNSTRKNVEQLNVAKKEKIQKI